MKKIVLINFNLIALVILLINCGSPETTRSDEINSLQGSNNGTSSNNITPIQALDIEKTFIPCGWIGDGEQGKRYIKLNPNCLEKPHSPPSCIEITYNIGPQGWGGIYWTYGDNPCNWGDKKGYNLSNRGFTKITFWAKGKEGNESVQFKAGGINGNKNGKPFNDSFDYEPKLYKNLSTTWEQYTLDITGKDLSNVIGGFCWIANMSVTFYLDDIFFE